MKSPALQTHTPRSLSRSTALSSAGLARFLAGLAVGMSLAFGTSLLLLTLGYLSFHAQQFWPLSLLLSAFANVLRFCLTARVFNCPGPLALVYVVVIPARQHSFSILLGENGRSHEGEQKDSEGQDGTQAAGSIERGWIMNGR